MDRREMARPRRRQGAWVLTNATGQVLKRGHELGPVLAFFDKKRFQVVD